MPPLTSPARGAADVPLVAVLQWDAAYPSLATEDYEGSAVGWRTSHPNQGLSTQEARSGTSSWRVESSSGCDEGCQYMTNKSFQADQLDPDATYVFSAWVKAPADHDDVHIQFKYKSGGQWTSAGGAAKMSYTGGGAWQRLEVQLDLSGISGLEVLNPVTRNVGDRAIAAYWDDVQLSVEQGPASGYDVQVAKDAAFDSLVTDATGLTQASRADTLIRYAEDYYWRVRASNSGGTGPWSAGRPLTTREAPRRIPTSKNALYFVR